MSAPLGTRTGISTGGMTGISTRIRTTEVLAADPAEMVISMEILTEASTGALAGIRTEILLKESADDAEIDEGLDGDFDGSLGMGPD